MGSMPDTDTFTVRPWASSTAVVCRPSGDVEVVCDDALWKAMVEPSPFSVSVSSCDVRLSGSPGCARFTVRSCVRRWVSGAGVVVVVEAGDGREEEEARVGLFGAADGAAVGERGDGGAVVAEARARLGAEREGVEPAPVANRVARDLVAGGLAECGRSRDGEAAWDARAGEGVGAGAREVRLLEAAERVEIVGGGEGPRVGERVEEALRPVRERDGFVVGVDDRRQHLVRM